MNIKELANVLGHNIGSRIESIGPSPLKAYLKEKRLAKLLDYATKKSPFYKNFRGKNLEDFPIMNKEIMRENFDQLVTDQRILFDEAFSYADRKDLYLDEYRVMTTSGTTGERGLILMNKSEWYKTMAAYLRAYEMAGKKFSPTNPQKMALVASHQEWHQSTKIANFSQSRWFPTLYLDVMQPLDEIVKQLNEFQPDLLAGYSGFMRILALEQIKGNLKLLPKSVVCSAEALTEESRQLMRKAWAIEPYNLYAASETGPIGMQCNHHDGLHVLEDRLVIEIVDENYKPVPKGEKGAKALFTSLDTRSLPLIRYEISDCLELRDGPCRCGYEGMLLENIEGRCQDQLDLINDKKEKKTLHPIFFYSVMEQEWIHKWQVKQISHSKLDLILENTDKQTASRLQEQFRAKLKEHGFSSVKASVTTSDYIPLSKNGKRKLIVTL